MQYKKVVITDPVGFTHLPAWLIPNNSLGCHFGAGRNPAIKNTPQSRQNHDVVSLAWGFINHLDTGLRRYGANFVNGLFGLMHDNEGAHE